MEKAVAVAESAAQIARERAAPASVIAFLAASAASRAEEVGRQLEKIAQPSLDKLSEADQRAIQIRQSSRRTGGKTKSGRELVELTFKVAVDPRTAGKSAAEVLGHVEKVDYVFDERWFKPPLRSVSDPTKNFSFAMRVWGVTTVRAAIHLVAPHKILIREGTMTLTKPGVLAD